MQRLLIFDAEGVLYKIDKKKTKRYIKSFLKEIGVSFGVSEKAWKEAKRLGKSKNLSWKEIQKIWFKKAGIPFNFLEKWYKFHDKVLWRKCVFKFPWANWMLNKLHKDYHIAVLSDSHFTSMELKRKMKTLGIKTELIDKVFSSYEIGKEKPHPKSYKTVMKHFGVSFKNTVFIGHSRDEIEGAKKLGIVTISIKNKYGNFHVNSLRHIPRILNFLAKQKDHSKRKI